MGQVSPQDPGGVEEPESLPQLRVIPSAPFFVPNTFAQYITNFMDFNILSQGSPLERAHSPLPHARTGRTVNRVASTKPQGLLVERESDPPRQAAVACPGPVQGTEKVAEGQGGAVGKATGETTVPHSKLSCPSKVDYWLH